MGLYCLALRILESIDSGVCHTITYIRGMALKRLFHVQILESSWRAIFRLNYLVSVTISRAVLSLCFGSVLCLALRNAWCSVIPY